MFNLEMVRDAVEFFIGSEPSKRQRAVPASENNDGLTQSMMQILSSYAKVAPWERRCVFAVVARTDPAELHQFRSAFRELDVDDDGTISRDDLAASVKKVRVQSFTSEDVDKLFDAADLTRTGFISFIEFSAACLHGRLCPLDRWLAGQAFEAIDVDQDGMLTARDVKSMFGDIPERLPLDRPVGVEEWTCCILAETSSETNPGFRKRSVVEIFFGAYGQQPIEPNVDQEVKARSISDAIEEVVAVNDSCVPSERTKADLAASVSCDKRPLLLESCGSTFSAGRAKRARQQRLPTSSCRHHHTVLCLSSPSYVPVSTAC